MDLGSSEASSEAVFLQETSFSLACGCEFCEVVCGADHGPFGFDLVDAAQEELAEASCLLDLAEDGLDDLFSQSIPASIACALELCAHSGDERAGFELPFGRGRLAAVAGAVVVRLRGCLGFGFRFQRGLGGTDLLQPLLFVGHPLGHLVATPGGSELTILNLVGLGGLSQPVLDLCRKPRLGLFHPAIAHRLVDPGIGLDLGAVERHMAKLHEPRLAAQRKNLPEQSGESSQMALAKLADRAEVRTPHPGYCRKSQALLAA